MTWRSRIAIEVAIGRRGKAVGDAVWGSALWDAGTWSGLEPTFIVQSNATVEQFSCKRGRDSPTSRISAGTGNLVLVYPAPTGPTPRGGQWSFRDTTTPVALGDEVRVRARVDNGLLVSIFRGFVDSVKDGWTTTGDGKEGVFRLQLGLVDRFSELGGVNLPERTPEGAGELTSARLTRIMGLAQIPTFYSNILPGTVTVQASNFARNLMDEAMITVESEAGAVLYVDPAGTFVFKPRGWIDTEPRSATARVTWTNIPFATTDVWPTDFSTGLSRRDIINHVAMARAGGSQIIVEDQNSQLEFGLKTYQRFDLIAETDGNVAYAAGYHLAQFAHRTRYVDEIWCDLMTLDTTTRISRVLDTELGDGHALRWDDASGQPTFQSLFHVVGVEHRVTGSRWEVGVNLWDYENVATAAGWDIGLWGTAQWSA